MYIFVQYKLIFLKYLCIYILSYFNFRSDNPLKYVFWKTTLYYLCADEATNTIKLLKVLEKAHALNLLSIRIPRKMSSRVF